MVLSGGVSQTILLQRLLNPSLRLDVGFGTFPLGNWRGWDFYHPAAMAASGCGYMVC